MCVWFNVFLSENISSTTFSFITKKENKIYNKKHREQSKGAKQKQKMSNNDSTTPTAPDEDASMWSNPADHFRPKSKLATLYTEKFWVVQQWFNIKETLLNHWWVPWWTPIYQIPVWFTQRNHNCFLVENHLSYRPYKFRANDITSKYYETGFF